MIRTSAERRAAHNLESIERWIRFSSLDRNSIWCAISDPWACFPESWMESR